MNRPSPYALALGALASFAACSSPGAEPEVAGLERWSVPTEPTLAIGRVEGDERYLFGRIESVLPLDDDRIAVSDGDATSVSLFGRDGTFRRRFGSRGDGPGEFRGVGRLRAGPADSLMVLDAGRHPSVVVVVSDEGEYGRTLPAVEMSGDSVFRLDVWLHDRFLVDGALEPAERAGVRAALDALPPPTSGSGWREVRVARTGDLWIREPGPDSAATTWTVVARDGGPRAVATTPARFDPRAFGESELLGVWTDPTGVHMVRAYDLVRDPDADVPPPAWLSAAPDTGAAATPPPTDEEFLEAIRGSIRQIAAAQEMHYAGNMTYTSDRSVLEEVRHLDLPEGLEIDFMHAGTRGWGAIFTHPGVDRICALAYGSPMPPGWTPGAVTCAPDRPAAGA